ncbi:hypothetical protein MAFF211271_16580 [Ralstonia syzygii subsp. indonesiensis]|nr:hypothetical protein MAFF211271_16580 [Ralstonia pseudosolanacearum]
MRESLQGMWTCFGRGPLGKHGYMLADRFTITNRGLQKASGLYMHEKDAYPERNALRATMRAQAEDLKAAHADREQMAAEVARLTARLEAQQMLLTYYRTRFLVRRCHARQPQTLPFP